MNVRLLDWEYAVLETTSGSTYVRNLESGAQVMVLNAIFEFVAINASGLLAGTHNNTLYIYDCNTGATVMLYPLPAPATHLAIGGYICVLGHANRFSVLWLRGAHVGRAIDVPTTTDVVSLATRATSARVIVGHECGFVCEYKFVVDSPPMVYAIAYLHKPARIVCDDTGDGALAITDTKLTLWGPTRKTSQQTIITNELHDPVELQPNVCGVRITNQDVWVCWPEGVANVGGNCACECRGSVGVAVVRGMAVVCNNDGVLSMIVQNPD